MEVQSARVAKTESARHTKTGKKLTEAGHDVDDLIARRGKRGRPTLGSAPASVESVRLDPELREALSSRAEAEGTSTSEVIRRALREYFKAAG